MSKLMSDAFGVAKGGRMVAQAALKTQRKTLDKAWETSSVKQAIDNSGLIKFPVRDMGELQKIVQEMAGRVGVVTAGISQMTKLTSQGVMPGQCGKETPPSLITSDDYVASGLKNDQSSLNNSNEAKKKRTNFLPPRPERKNIVFSAPQLSSRSHESSVPSSRLGRLVSYGNLAVGLGAGALAEVTRRGLGFGGVTEDSVVQTVLGNENPFLTEANAERIVKTLCRVRGAALKLGQMLSLQDGTMISPQLGNILERVRDSADFMPLRQVEKVMCEEFGPQWRSKFADFEDKPFAAASIGQVHRASLDDGSVVALKIQYPGVATSINSDINNLVTVLNLSSLFPKGLYLEEFIDVAKQELALECDYLFEAEAHKRFREFFQDRDDFYVPKVYDELTTKSVMTTEFINGVALDKCVDMDEITRDWIGTKIIELCLTELAQFNYMQTDPNWSNFFYDQQNSRMILLDFGASRSYSRDFVFQYLRILKAARDDRKEDIIKYSIEIGFLTGYETKLMMEAHTDAVLIMAEVLNSDLFDFGAQRITNNIQSVLPIMLKHRLTPPPQEIYSLHRKLSGAFLLCAKLRSKVPCRDLFDNAYETFHGDI